MYWLRRRDELVRSEMACLINEEKRGGVAIREGYDQHSRLWGEEDNLKVMPPRAETLSVDEVYERGIVAEQRRKRTPPRRSPPRRAQPPPAKRARYSKNGTLKITTPVKGVKYCGAFQGKSSCHNPSVQRRRPQVRGHA